MSTSSGDNVTSASGDASMKDPLKGSEVSAAAKPPRTQAQGVQLLSLAVKSVKVAGLLLAVWLIGYFGFSVTWVLIALVCYVVGNEYSRTKEAKRAYAKDAAQDEQRAILARVDELPAWVYFPDVERAEWLNKMIQQMWPYIGEFVKNLLKTSVETVINANLPEKLKPFRFEKIHLGSVPPRLGGVKVYIDKVKRDEIIMDVELSYASDADITVSVRGLSAGVKDILLQGTIRIIMRPLISQIPLVGGLCVFFLNQPKIDFDLTNVANILDMPLLSTSLRTIVSDQIANFLVLPNKLAIRLVENISIADLKYPMPAGVVRLTIVEASELIKADFGMISKGKSDPYCKIYAGGCSYKTAVVQNSITPIWNETFEIVIDQKHGQVVDIDVMDEDPGDDDELGSVLLDLDQLSSSGFLDAWLILENVKTGRLHLRAQWLYLSRNMEDIYKAKTCRGSDSHLSTALLMVTVDSAKDLLAGRQAISEPSAYVRLEVGNHEAKTQVRQKTTNPRWEQSFHFLLVDPELQDLFLEVFDTSKNNRRLGVCKLSLRHVLTSDDMTMNRPFSLKEAEAECSITLRLVLRLLTPDQREETIEGEELQKVGKKATGEPAEDRQPVQTSEKTESVGQRTSNLESHSDNISSGLTDSSGLRYRGPSVPSDGRFGQIKVTVRYSTQRSQLIVVVHQCNNLIPCDDDNLSDPSVRLILLPDKSSKKKTHTQKNTLNPVFDETFDWPVSKEEAATRTLELTVKNSVGLFSKNRVNMGFVQLNLFEIDDLCKTVTEWYDLQSPDEISSLLAQ